MIKRDIFSEAEKFDERFFLYVEDVDLSWRLRLLGYQIGFAPEAKVAHYVSGSAGSKSVDAQKLYYCHRNLLRAILKNCGSSLGWAVRNCLLFSFIITVGFSVFEPRKAVAIMRAILWNLANFRNSYAWRVRIQTSRARSDADILTRIYPRLSRYQPTEHVELRRILNTLFEHSQCSMDVPLIGNPL